MPTDGMQETPGEVTQLLNQAAGDSEEATRARDRLAALVHEDLHRIANAHFHNESPGHTLQPTAIVNEGWMKLAEQDRVQWQDREHFLAVASLAMRRILLDHAKGRKRLRRGGDRKRQNFTETIAMKTDSGWRLEEIAYLESLGATTVIDRAELSEPSKRPLARVRWAGAVDAVGSHTLANVLAAVSPEGCVAACGLAQGMDLTTTVAPFILRGLTLRGVHSVTVPRPRRLLAWERLATDLDTDLLGSMTETISLDEVPHTAAEILAGRVRGRVVVDLNDI